MPELVVLEQVSGEAIDALTSELDSVCVPTLDQAGGLAGVRALIVRNQTQVDDALIRSLPALEVVGRAGAGLDNIDLEAASRAGLVVTYAPEANTTSTAQHTVALALCHARRIVELDRATHAGRWQRDLGCELADDTWGVIGLGRIGRGVARLAQALGMEVLAFDPQVDDRDLREQGIRPCSFEELLGTARVISMHVPLNNATRHLVGRAELRLMRQDALLINTARGGLVDELALADALREKRIAGAALDVRETEPPGGADPLRGIDSVLLTPHVAGLTVQAQDRVTRTIADDIRAVLAGGAPQSAIVDARREHSTNNEIKEPT